MRVGKPQRSFVRPTVVAAAALAATLLAAGIVRADYPDRPITIIVGFPPGGSDLVARMLGVPLEGQLGGMSRPFEWPLRHARKRAA
jgi:tripartite-type tricarboxylate transporter receptor subunit TctC